MKNNVMVGIDLGFRHTGIVWATPTHDQVGYAIVGWACVSTEKADKKKGLFVAQDDVQQCQKLYRDTIATIRGVNPTALVAELPTAGAKGARANRAMGIATGMISAVVEETGLPCIWVSPDESKRTLCQKRNAGKDEMMNGIQALWPTFSWPKTKGEFEHVADAAAALLVARTSDIYKFMRGTAE